MLAFKIAEMPSLLLPLMFRRLWSVLLLLAVALASLNARGDAMLQLFNQSWSAVMDKMPEIAEAGYTSLWLPPPTKGGSGYSVGYDLFDPFDLGDKDQRGTVATQYGTKQELLEMVRVAHRFGIRVYFDNIVNHRAFDVPGYDANTPTNLYPGMVPGDFHLRTTSDGYFRNASNIRDYSSQWQVQNLSLSGLIDIAQENPNANFGPTEGSTAPKPVIVRHSTHPEYYDYHPTLGHVGFGNVSQSVLSSNTAFYQEDVGAYQIRSVRYLIDQTKCDGLRLDAVKHVPSYFFGQQSGSDKDTSTSGYVGNAQQQFNWTHGFTDSNMRNANFDTEMTRNDALIFGEHLGEPPTYSEYVDAGMRLLDNPLRNYLNNVLGNPSATLAGLEQRDGGGFAASVRVMHAQSHDNDYAAHRELQNAYYFLREGVPLIYSDGYNESPSNGGTPFPRHANAPYLGEFGDNKMPDLAWIHHQLARGGTTPRWGDADICAFERYDYREGSSSAPQDQTVVLFVMNDNYGNPGDISFDDGVPQDDSGMPSTCYPVVNTRNQGLVVGFPPGSHLRQLADSPSKNRACPELLVRLATTNRTEAEGSMNDPNPVNRKVFVGTQALAPGGGAIEFKIPSGSYVAYAYQWPEASRVDTTLTNSAGLVAATDAIVIQQGGRTVPRMTVYRTDGKDGDAGFNPLYPFKMRGSVDSSGNVIGGANLSNLTYSISVPVVTNGLMDILLRTDGSTVNTLLKLDGGVDINSQMGLGASNTFTGGALDLRDQKPGSATDVFLGYEDTAFAFRYGPEKFAARDIARDTVLSAGAETYGYTVGSSSTADVVNGSGFGASYPEQTCAWVYHDPAAPVTVAGVTATRTNIMSFTNSWRYDQSGWDLDGTWRQVDYNDTGWSNGLGLLAKEDRVLDQPINTVLALSNAANQRITNFYFRTHFTIADPSAVSVTASNLIDDGAVFWLNGVEVYRYNMPTGPITATTFATNVVEATNYVVFTLPPEVLFAGDNLMAVEVHQANANSSDVVFGMSLTATAAPRQRSSTLGVAPVDIWVKVGYQNQANRCFIYVTTAPGFNPEGAYGVGNGGITQVVQCSFAGHDAQDSTIDWWHGTLAAGSSGTRVKYKIALFNNNAGTIIDYADSKHYALTQFAITNWNPATATVWLHNDLNTNNMITGLEEGFHILRARAFLPRSGKSSVFNTFLQTFYYDAQPPDGVIAFPSPDNTTVRSTDYDVVVRADETATLVEYNIIDSDPNNDDVNTGFNNGNGLSNGVPVFATANLVSPLGSLSQQYPNLPQEFRFTWFAVPSNGTATITVRIKELTSSLFTNRFRTLTRIVNAAAPPQTLSIAFPTSNGQNINLNQSNTYEIVSCFSDTLTANSNLFTISIDGADQPRSAYRFQGSYCGTGKRDLRYTWAGMSAGQHYIQIQYVGDGLNLQASRLVRVTLFGVIDTDGDGLPDSWETQHHLDPEDSTGDNGADGDPDHDGFTNLQEYLAGTDPQDPNSLLKIMNLSNGGQVVTWLSIPGKNYQVLSTPLVTQSFDPLSGNITAYSTNTSYTNLSAPASQLFYRVRVLP